MEHMDRSNSELEQLRNIVRQAKITTKPINENVQHTNNDEKWIRNFHSLQTFYSINLRLPKTKEEINGVPIGRWLANQRRQFKRGELAPYRLEILNRTHPVWSGNQQEQREYELDSKENFLVEYALVNNKTPLTKLRDITAEEILDCYENQVYTVEELLKRTKDTEAEFRALEAIYSNYINLNYINLLREVYQVKSAKQLIKKVNMREIVGEINEILRENSQDSGARALVRYYGLFGRPTKTLRDLAKELGVSHETVRVRVNKGMEILTDKLASYI